ncbi:hypothetical protein [Burkholderia sp. GS2Y]|uniref:Uncharacterized protein n=1 Tax=Burkholderia theae TaxID=3143496 RepID=A0ABU9WJT3_9BURK
MKLKTLICLMTFAWRMGFLRGKGDTRPAASMYMEVVRPQRDVEMSSMDDGEDVGVLLAKLGASNDWTVE